MNTIKIKMQKTKNKKPLNEIQILDKGIRIIKDIGKKLNIDNRGKKT